MSEPATARQISYIHNLLKGLGLNGQFKFDPADLTKEKASDIIDNLTQMHSAVHSPLNKDNKEVFSEVELYANIYKEVSNHLLLSDLNTGEQLRIATSIYIQMKKPEDDEDGGA